jgi:hypothetical protein
MSVPSSGSSTSVAFTINQASSIAWNWKTYGVHDVAVTNVSPYKTVVGQGLSMTINVTSANYGNYSESFTVTVYANTTVIGNIAVTNLSPEATQTLTLTWKTTGFAKDNYTIWAYAVPLSGETHTIDNTFSGGWIIVAMVGDIASIRNGKLVDIPAGKVDMLDVGLVASQFGKRQGQQGWNPNCDLTGPKGVPDGRVDMLDVGLVASMFGKHDP